MNRITRWEVLAMLAAVLPCIATAQEKAPGGTDKTKDLVLEWPCPAKGKPRLRLMGKIPLPDGIVLKISLSRLDEQIAHGHLAAVATGDARTGAASVERGRCVFFERTEEFVEPGTYRAVVDLPQDLQAPALQETARKAVPKKWEFTFFMWGDDWLDPCGAGLPKVQALAESYVEFADHMEHALKECTSTEDWTAQFLPAVQKEMGALNTKLDDDARQFYPAALREIAETVKALGLNLPYCYFYNGKFSGVRSPPNVQALGRNPVYFGILKRDLALIKEVAGRELALWVLKDSRRAKKPAPSLLGAVREHADLPGVKFFASSLQELSEESDLAQLEKDIRR